MHLNQETKSRDEIPTLIRSFILSFVQETKNLLEALKWTCKLQKLFAQIKNLNKGIDINKMRREKLMVGWLVVTVL